MNVSSHIATVGEHETEIARIFGSATPYDGPPVFDHDLMILGFTNRSGSNLLAEHITSNGLVTGFVEQLNWEAVNAYIRRTPVTSLAEYVVSVTEKTGAPPAPHGFKASWAQLLMLLRLNIPALYTGVRVIHIERQNLLAQAVSFSIADQTKKWTSAHEGLEDVEVAYDAEDIARRLNGTIVSNGMMRYVCDLFAIPRLTVEYEALIEKPRAQVKRIANFLDIEVTAKPAARLALQKQRDARNADFIARFEAEARQRALEATPATTPEEAVAEPAAPAPRRPLNWLRRRP